MRKIKGIMLTAAIVSLAGVSLSFAGCSKDDKKEETSSEVVSTTQAEAATTAEVSSEAESESETQEVTTQEESTTEEVTESAMSNISLKDLAQKLQATGGYADMHEYPSDDLMDYYGIDTSLCDEFVFYVADVSPKADTIAMFKCKSKEAADEIAQKLEGYLSFMVDSTVDYAPEEYDKTKKTGVSTFDNFVELIITSDQKSSQAVLDEYISANFN